MSRQHDREVPDAAQQTTKARPSPTPSREPDEDLRSSVGNSGMGELLQPSVTDTIENELGGGDPLSASAAKRAVAVHSAKDVRIHDDGTAAALSREMGAVAFTFGRDIFLAGNAPALDSEDGQAMLRHELTHVDQQAETGTTRPRRVSSPDSRAEQQATRVQHGDQGGAVSAGTAAVHRQGEEEEEMAMTMREETVHRQGEEEEEMAMTMREETVHRVVEDEETEADLAADVDAGPAESSAPDSPATEEAAPEPANPALAALFEQTVVEKIARAQELVSTDPPQAELAVQSLNDAGQAIHSMLPSYSETDPLLATELRLARAAIISSINELWPFTERAPDLNHAREELASIASNIRSRLTNRLH